MSICRAPERRGVVQAASQHAIGTPAIDFGALSAIMVTAAPEVSGIGEGQITIDEAETYRLGGLPPIAGGYQESITLTIPVQGFLPLSVRDAPSGLMALLLGSNVAIAPILTDANGEEINYVPAVQGVWAWVADNEPLAEDPSVYESDGVWYYTADSEPVPLELIHEIGGSPALYEYAETSTPVWDAPTPPEYIYSGMTQTPRAGACIGVDPAQSMPFTLRWVTEGEMTQTWYDCQAALVSIQGESSGAIVTMTFQVIGTPIKTAYSAPTDPDYSAWDRILTGRGATLELSDMTHQPSGLYSWTWTTGYTTQEVPDQLRGSGFGLAFSYMTDASTFEINAPAGSFTLEAWDRFFDQVSTGALTFTVGGGEPQPEPWHTTLQLTAPSAYMSDQSRGTEAGARSDGRTLSLRATDADPLPWRLTSFVTAIETPEDPR